MEKEPAMNVIEWRCDCGYIAFEWDDADQHEKKYFGHRCKKKEIENGTDKDTGSVGED